MSKQSKSWDRLFRALPQLIDNRRDAYADDVLKILNHLLDGAQHCARKGEVYDAGMFLVELGQLLGHRQLHLRVLKQYLRRKASAQDMGRGNALGDGEIERRRVEWQRLVDEMMRKNPGMKYLVATNRVGRLIDPPVTGRWVRRFTSDPRKKT